MTEIGSITSIVVIIGVFIGIVARTVLRFMEKLKAAENAGDVLKFDHKFMITAVIAFIAALAPTITLFPTVLALVGGENSSLALASVLVISAMAAYGSNEAINYTVKVTEKSAVNAALRVREKEEQQQNSSQK